jgi:alpha-N-acetylglucosamine transferase
MWTFLTDGEGYAVSIIKLLTSIRRNTNFQIDLLVMEMTNKPINKKVRKRIEEAGAQICEVERIAPRDEGGTFPRFRDQFTKFRLWEMIEYESCTYLDTDCLVIRNIDHLFNVHKLFHPKNQKIGACRDFYADKFTDTFNMGVFVVKPDKAEFERLVSLKNNASFKFRADLCEQGFLNKVYKDQWYEISFEYNANLDVYHEERKYWNDRAENIRVIHYTENKPWDCGDKFKEPCDIWRNYTV